jgi:cell division protein FtsN
VPGSARDPAAILNSGAASVPPPTTGAAAVPYVFFVQTGAYARSEEAEQQRAKLALLGLTARISEREQNGRTVYRVCLGPVEARPDAESLQQRLQDAGMESQLVRVERP